MNEAWYQNRVAKQLERIIILEAELKAVKDAMQKMVAKGIKLEPIKVSHPKPSMTPEDLERFLPYRHEVIND